MDKIDKLFFEFIYELNNAGEIAHSETKASNFQSSNKKLVLETLKEYEQILEKVNDKFKKLKTETEIVYPN
jgi:hypothetical protein